VGYCWATSAARSKERQLPGARAESGNKTHVHSLPANAEWGLHQQLLPRSRQTGLIPSCIQYDKQAAGRRRRRPSCILCLGADDEAKELTVLNATRYKFLTAQMHPGLVRAHRMIPSGAFLISPSLGRYRGSPIFHFVKNVGPALLLFPTEHLPQLSIFPSACQELRAYP
jgi:hypothetical protein